MKYTAQEMREAADSFWVGGVVCEVKDKDGHVVKHIKHDAVIAMLRQAADATELEELRDKKYAERRDKKYEERRGKRYEYSIYPPDVHGVFQSLNTAELIAKANKLAGLDVSIIVRRDVGEWEAAEALAHEEKRERKYEYGLKRPDGTITVYKRLESANKDCAISNADGIAASVVRRKVGAWEKACNV